MAFSFDTKPSAVGYSNDAENVSGIPAGVPIGLLLSLTYPGGVETYAFDSEPTAISYTNDSKP